MYLFGVNPSILALACLIFTAFATAFGQTPASFSGARAYLGNSAAIADFTHDGIPDLATIDPLTSAIHIHAGLGNGTFAGDESIVLTTVGNGASSFALATADLNGDGLPDLVVTFSKNGQHPIFTLLGAAGGGFTRAPVSMLTTELGNFYITDVNQDGKPDLVVVGSSGAGMLLGNGDGTFQPESQVFAQPVPQPGLAIGDFNGDGKPDLAIPVANGIFILFGDGTGRFPNGTTFTTTEEFGPITAADVNGDGKQDLVVETYLKGLVEVLFGNGDGSFGVAQVYFIGGQGGYGATGLAVGDVNGDGILDIVTPDPAVLLGKGDGTFANPVLYPSNPYWQTVQLADLSGNGRMDIVGDVTYRGENNLFNTTVLLNVGSGKFQNGENIQLKGAADCITIADFNNDGHDDAAVNVPNGVQLLLGTGQSKTAFQRASLLSFPSANGTCPIAGDFNDDGIPDLLVGEGNGAISFLAGRGNGTFAPAVVTTAGLESRLVTGNFNGDGNLDIAGASGSAVEVLMGNGAGGFSNLASLPNSGSLLYWLAAADLNGDGLADLAEITSPVSGPVQITVYLNKGGGVFQPHVYPLPTLYFYGGSLSVVDLNNDGIPDLAVFGNPSSYVLLGQGGGLFAQPSQLESPGVFGVAADMNGDGFPDLAVVDDFEVKIFLGNGTGSFSSPGNPDGLWFAPPGPAVIVAAYLQSQSASSGLADVVTVGAALDGGYASVLLNQAVTPPK